MVSESSPCGSPLLLNMQRALRSFSLIFLSLPGASGSSLTSCEYRGSLGERGSAGQVPYSGCHLSGVSQPALTAG